ncbi:MAG TPA: transglutaminase-like domain-containing protein [Cyclobacteriaceae bacterium]|nr:transglutaminase-like domain-containing protein [Cyclobacteriaceae bacterium]
MLASCQLDSENKKEGKDNSDPVEKRVDIADIEVGIRLYIEKKVRESKGYFHFKDNHRDLRLKLVRVHTEYLSSLGPRHHFACVDLADANGDVYDVDFFLKGDSGDMRVTQTTLHKLNGKPFYSWKQRKDKTWHRVAVEEASRELLGIIEGEDEFEFYYQVELPEIKEDAKAWIPIARSDSFQTIELIRLKTPGKRKMLEEKQYDNLILYLELGEESSNKQIEIAYRVARREKGPYIEQTPVAGIYLESNLLVPVNTRFRSIANETLQGKHEESTLVQARVLYDYVIENMRYAKFGDYGSGDAVYACDSKTGNCTEFHSLFIALARSAGIPARFAVGASIPSERNEGGIDGYHCWAEFYAEGKWWPVDISEADKYSNLATYYFGRHPANRIELSRGRDLVVEPGPESGPINFHAYPVLEIDGHQIKPETSFSFIRKPTR